MLSIRALAEDMLAEQEEVLRQRVEANDRSEQRNLLLALAALGVALLFFAWDLPRPDVALATTRRPSVTLEASDGRLLATSGDL
ncbi:hypothetical protein LTR94_034451, partial [Friedmanniomyces endolithicus]